MRVGACAISAEMPCPSGGGAPSIEHTTADCPGPGPGLKNSSDDPAAKRQVVIIAEPQPQPGGLGALSILPTEAVLTILARLPIKQIYKHLALVCKEMHSLTRNSAVLPSTLDVSGWHSKLPFGKLLQILTALCKLDGQDTKGLKIGNVQFGKTSFKKLLKLCPGLESLDAGTSKKLHICNFVDLNLAAAPMLKSFTWGWLYSVSQDCIIANLLAGRDKLEVLNLSCFETLGDTVTVSGDRIFNPRLGGADNELLAALAANCPNLRELRLSGSLNFSLAAANAVGNACTKLTTVVLRNHCVFKHAHAEGTVDLLHRLFPDGYPSDEQLMRDMGWRRYEPSASMTDVANRMLSCAAAAKLAAAEEAAALNYRKEPACFCI
jgi:hypothetical protein